MEFRYLAPADARRLRVRLDGSIGHALWNDYLARVLIEDGTYVVRSAGDCTSPFKRDVLCPPGLGTAKVQWKWVDDLPEWEMPDFKEVRTWVGGSPLEEGFTARFYHRCRKCRACRLWRRNGWIARATEEMRRSERTWMCTFTFTDEHFASLSLPARPADYERIAVAHGQRYLKRLRAEGFSLRYLLVTEFGEHTGRVHLHALIHTTAALSKRRLEKQWTSGFTHARLVRDGDKNYARASAYVAKYLTKSLTSRVRASLRYGFSPQDIATSPLGARPAKGVACIQGLQDAGRPQDEGGSMPPESCPF